MKKLTLIRHGKSTWEYQVRDHDRVLKERGIQDAHLIGSYLKKNSFNRYFEKNDFESKKKFVKTKIFLRS